VLPLAGLSGEERRVVRQTRVVDAHVHAAQRRVTPATDTVLKHSSLGTVKTNYSLLAIIKLTKTGDSSYIIDFILYYKKLKLII